VPECVNQRQELSCTQNPPGKDFVSRTCYQNIYIDGAITIIMEQKNMF